MTAAFIVGDEEHVLPQESRDAEGRLAGVVSRGCISDTEPADADRRFLRRAVFVVESLTESQLVRELAYQVSEKGERTSLDLSALLILDGEWVIALLLWTDHGPFLVDQAARSLVRRHLSTGRALFQRWV